MKELNTQMMIKVAVMATLAAVVMIFEFPVPFAPPFYKIDFSEVIVLLAGISLGVIPAILVEALKIIINLLIHGTTTMGIGEFANFLMGIAFVIPATYIYRKYQTRKHMIIGLLISTITLCVVATILNYFILLPVYASVYQIPVDDLVAMGTAINPNINSLLTFVLLAVVPFNLLKGILTSLVVLSVYRRIMPVIKGKSA